MALIPEETIDRLYGEVSVALIDRKETITLDLLLKEFREKLLTSSKKDEISALKSIISVLTERRRSGAEKVNLDDINSDINRKVGGE